MKKADMHMHTCASDGTWDVYDLKKELIKSKISIFSITDHDCVDNIKSMQEIIEPGDNLMFIPGTELTTEYEGREYHLTMYNYDINNEALLNLIKWTNESKVSTNSRFIGSYAASKFDGVSLEDYQQYDYDRKRGGWKSLNYMLDKGIHENISAHFVDFGKSGMKAKLKGPEKVIKIAKESGGKVFLAHPSYHYKDKPMPQEELKYWLSLGIDGIECFSPYNVGSEEYYKEFCKKNDLMISGGSDCHGEFIPARRLGMPEVYLEELNLKKIL